MERERVEELQHHGCLVSSEGRESVRVTLQFRGLPAVDRGSRRSLLESAIHSLRPQLSSEGVVVDPHSISVSAQTAEATIPVDSFDHLVQVLDAKDVRVDPLRERSFDGAEKTPELDVDAVKTFIEIAAICLTIDPESGFMIEELLAEARALAGEHAHLLEADVLSTPEVADFLETKSDGRLGLK